METENANTARIPHKNVTTEKADADQLLGDNVGERTTHKASGSCGIKFRLCYYLAFTNLSEISFPILGVVVIVPMS